MTSAGIASHTTQIIFDRLAAFGRPATVDELVDAIIAGPHVPWNGIHQRYQQHLCQAHAKRAGGTLNGSNVPPGFDPALGWQYPGYEPLARRREAMTYVVRTTLRNQSVNRALPAGRTIRRWAVPHPDDRWSVTDDETQHPQVRLADGSVGTYDSVTRDEIAADKAAQIAVVNRSSDRRAFDLADADLQATLLRWLTAKLPVSKSAASRARPVLNDWSRRVETPEQALVLLRDLLCRDQ